MKLKQALLARLGLGKPRNDEPDAFELALKRLERAQPQNPRYRQLFRNRQTRLAA